MEKLMQYLWQYRLLRPGLMETVDHRPLEILDPGTLNTGPGPDFFNAKIRLDGKVWAGDVELHVRASDWHRHGHDGDAAYGGVILHVVHVDDVVIHGPDGEPIPQMVLPAAAELSRCRDYLRDRADRELPCASYVARLPRVHISSWLTALSTERMHVKAERVEEWRRRLGGDWRAATYVALARALGFGNNSDPFERLAFSMPLAFLAKHADDLILVEAALFGQSGLLADAPSLREGDYVATLKREYAFMVNKFSLKPPSSLNWRMGGTRPGNMPHRRIALLAILAVKVLMELDVLLTARDADEARAFLNVEYTGYWVNHTSFTGPDRVAHPEALSGASMHSLIINAVAPVLYAFWMHRGNDTRARMAMGMWEGLPPESNRLVSIFTHAGIRPADAFTSQGLIHLRREYCEKRKCLYCRFGHHIMRAQSQALVTT